MRKNSKIIIFSLLLIAIAAVGYNWDKSPAPDPAQAKMYSTQTANMLALSYEASQELFDNRAYARWSFNTAEEAGEKLPFAFSIPDETLTGKPTLIYITKSEARDRILGIHYAGGVNGIRFGAILVPNQPDYSEVVNELKTNIESGICKGDKAPTLIDIEGYQAFAAEPGFNIIDGDKVPRMGVVEWWKDGVDYHLYGTRGPDGTSLEELVSIAKSVINSETVIPAGIQLSPQELNRRVEESPIQPEDMDNEKTELEEYE